MCNLACVVAYASLGLAEVAGEVGDLPAFDVGGDGKISRATRARFVISLVHAGEKGFWEGADCSTSSGRGCTMHDFGSRLLIRVDQIPG